MLGALALTGADDGGGRPARGADGVRQRLRPGRGRRLPHRRRARRADHELRRAGVAKSGPPKAIVKATIERSGAAAELRRDASCTIRPQSLVGEYYVDCQPGSSRERLGEDEVVPLRRTEGTIPQDLVNDVLRRPTRERLRLFVASLGTGLAGRPAGHPGRAAALVPGPARDAQDAADPGRPEPRRSSSSSPTRTPWSRGCTTRRADVTDFIRESRGAAETGASRRAELREGVRRLPGFLAELRPTMAELSNLARQGTPAGGRAAAIGAGRHHAAAAPGPVLRGGAARAARAGRGRRCRPPRRCARAAGSWPPCARWRATRPPPSSRCARPSRAWTTAAARWTTTPRAALTAPPAPDPTADAAGRGFTGFESIVNYFFWQTMTTNGFDAIGHQLRVGATVSKCSPVPQRAAHRRRQRAAVQGLQLVAGPAPAGHQRARPVGARLGGVQGAGGQGRRAVDAQGRAAARS